MHVHTHTLWKVFVSLVCCNHNSSDSESDLGHPMRTSDNYHQMLHWLTNGALPLYPILSSFFLFHSHLPWCRNKQNLVCIPSFVKARQDCCNRDRPCVFFFFHFIQSFIPSLPFSIPPFHIGFYFMPVNPSCNLTSCALMEKTTSYLVMRESCLLQSRAGLIKLLFCSNRKHDKAFSHWPLLRRCDYLCQGFLSPASPLCVCKQGALLFLKATSLSACQTCPLYLMLDQGT